MSKVVKEIIGSLIKGLIITTISLIIMFILKKTNNNEFIIIAMSVICSCWLINTIENLIKEFNKED